MYLVHLSKQKQLLKHDCFRTAVACLLGVPAASVPNFTDHGDPTNTDETQRRLAEFVYPLIPFSFPITEDLLHGFASHCTREALYILEGTSIAGYHHCVVRRGSEMYSDPSPNGGGLSGPQSNGLYWITVFTLSPSDTHAIICPDH